MTENDKSQTGPNVLKKNNNHSYVLGDSVCKQNSKVH